MMQEEASLTILPVHLQPKADELLSSWLVRLAIAHAMKPEKFYSLILPLKPDFPLYVDETTDEYILNIISSVTGVHPKRVKNTTLTPYRDTLSNYYYPSTSGPRSMSYQWVMPITHRYSKYQLFGLQYCPSCLSEDETPYFRRRWRFAFVTTCGIHCTLLLDRCTRCESPIDFRRNASEVRKKKRPTLTMTKCYECNFDIQTAISSSPPRRTFSYDLDFQEFLIKALEKDEIRDHQGESYPASIFFNRLYSLTELIAFGGFGKFIRTELCYRYGLRAFTVAQPEKFQSLEMLNVKERFGLIRVAGCVMAEWLKDLMCFNWTNPSN